MDRPPVHEKSVNRRSVCRSVLLAYFLGRGKGALTSARGNCGPEPLDGLTAFFATLFAGAFFAGAFFAGAGFFAAGFAAAFFAAGIRFLYRVFNFTATKTSKVPLNRGHRKGLICAVAESSLR
jgi:hypothetical protein